MGTAGDMFCICGCFHKIFVYLVRLVGGREALEAAEVGTVTVLWARLAARPNRPPLRENRPRVTQIALHRPARATPGAAAPKEAMSIWRDLVAAVDLATALPGASR